MSKPSSNNFHDYSDNQKAFDLGNTSSANPAFDTHKYRTTFKREISYRFDPHFHPYVEVLSQQLIEKSVPGLQSMDTQYRRNPDGTFETFPDDYQDETKRGKPKPQLYQEGFEQSYVPKDELVEKPYPVRELDFSSSGAYSVYNWELFHHAPLTVAIHLSKNQRFEEAMHWFHFIFDPTDDSDGPTPERFWKVKPFQHTDVKLIEEILINLATGDDTKLESDTIDSINAWKDSPFRPHVVARYRPTAYMFKTVMAYLDNLIAWGDTLFRQDTGESINEATQLYVLAANILGTRPQAVPKKGSVRPQTYASLKQDLKELGTALTDFEADLPFDLSPSPHAASDSYQFKTLTSIGKALYFCVPQNDKLLSYWDTVADRLFKIRNSLNIQGIFRQLPLFEPPIDPALLAKAAAAGLDVAAIVSGLNQPLPLVRFQFLVQKAAEICQEVKSLGNNLLSAMEKEDNEALGIIRARHERIILGLAETVTYAQIQDAIKAREGLFKSLNNTIQRYTYHELLLGTTQENIDKIFKENTAFKDFMNEFTKELDKEFLANFEKMDFKNINEPTVGFRPITVDIAKDLSTEEGGRKLNTQEVEELRKQQQARDQLDKAADNEKQATGYSMFPDLTANAQALGIGPSSNLGGGSTFAKQSSLTASGHKTDGDKNIHEGTTVAKLGTYTTRERDWAFQSVLASGEINQIVKQLRGAQIREAIATLEGKKIKQQILHAETIEHFLSGEEQPDWKYKDIDTKDSKKTNQAFYAWMKRELQELYRQCFQLAFDIAKQAERALQHELGNPDLSYLQFNYLSGKESLLAGEKLYLDIKRMEMAYHEQNQREYELTKHVSLLQVNPTALLQLRTTGSCTVSLPEELFDIDCPGHYFRRIKTVALTIPCVTGPYASVNCTLTLNKSSIRKNSLLSSGSYERNGKEDDRFNDYFGSLSIVTSSGQNDSGLFETNLHDERYLPFEGSGVISAWQLQLPANPSKKEPCQFDYSTISDVILHIRYTAREGGTLLRDGAINNLNTLIASAKTVGSVRLFSIRHEFPSQWAKFTGIKDDIQTAKLELDLCEEHYPFWSQDSLGAIKQVDWFAKTEKRVAIIEKSDGTGKQYPLVKDSSLGNLQTIRLKNISSSPIGRFTSYFTDNKMDDLWLAITWGKKG